VNGTTKLTPPPACVKPARITAHGISKTTITSSPPKT